MSRTHQFIVFDSLLARTPPPASILRNEKDQREAMICYDCRRPRRLHNPGGSSGAFGRSQREVINLPASPCAARAAASRNMHFPRACGSSAPSTCTNQKEFSNCSIPSTLDSTAFTFVILALSLNRLRLWIERKRMEILFSPRSEPNVTLTEFVSFVCLHCCEYI